MIQGKFVLPFANGGLRRPNSLVPPSVRNGRISRLTDFELVPPLNELVGHGTAGHFEACDLRRRVQAQREDLMLQLVTLFPRDLTIVRRGGRWRTRLRLRTGRYISVVFSRTIRPWDNAIRWVVDPVLQERRFVTLLVRLDPENELIQDFYVVPNINRHSRFTLKLKDAWLDRGEPLLDLTKLREVVKRVGVRARSAQNHKAVAGC